MSSSALPLLAIGAGALAGAGLFVLIAAIRGLPPRAKSQGPSALERAIKENHSYSTPEIIAMPVVNGNMDYLAWVARETKQEE